MTVGVLVCSYNDLDLSQKMYSSLLGSFGEPYAWGLICVDAGSEDGSVAFWEGKCPTIHKDNDQLLRLLNIKGEDLRHLSHALNAGIALITLGDSKEFQKYDYICHIHPDMLFPQKKWLESMVSYMDEHKDVAKLAAEYATTPEGARQERPGNGCPWALRTKAVMELIEKDGFVFDPEFRDCGGLEDWDCNARLMNLGYKVWINPHVIVDHAGMGTRKKHDNNQAAVYNSNYYHQKWGIHEPPV